MPVSVLKTEQREIQRWILTRLQANTRVPGPLAIFGLIHVGADGQEREVISVKQGQPFMWENPVDMARFFLAHAWLHACTLDSIERFALVAAYFKPEVGGGRALARYDFQLDGADMSVRRKQIVTSAHLRRGSHVSSDRRATR